MKTILHGSFLAVLFLFCGTTKSQNLTFSMSSVNQCFNVGDSTFAIVTNTPVGAVSYSWSVMSSTCAAQVFTQTLDGSIVKIKYNCCGQYSIICTAISSSNTPIQVASAGQLLNCKPNVTASVGGSSVGCLGTTFTLAAFGAITYTWSNGIFGNPVVVAPTVSTCYSVSGSNGTCTAMAVACVSLYPFAPITISGNTIVCQGWPSTLTASGANSYTWTSPLFVGNPYTALPLTSTMYTVTGTDNFGCTSFATIPVLVNASPTLSIQYAPVSQSVTCGNSATITASGANTYMWNTGATTNSIVVTPINPPFSYAMYTVVGTNSSNGCTNTNTLSLYVAPLTLNIAGNNTVCLGSSVDFTASGASTYIWNNNSVGAVTNYLALWPTTVIVTGTAVNGCAGTGSTTIMPDSTCAIVWPGDANSDGIVNSSDVIEIGLAFNHTGSARNPGGNNFTAQFATAWTGFVSTGKNKCHADCNGDGTVNHNDTLAIFNNFLQTHTFRSAGSSANPEISLNFQGNSVVAGQWGKADVILGSAGNPVQLYGVTFDIDFDQTMIEANSGYLTYSPSFLNAASQNVIFRKQDHNAGKIYAASVRMSGNDVSGEGKIGEFWFKVKEGVPANSKLNAGISGGTRYNLSGAGTPLSSETYTVSISDPSGLSEKELAAKTAWYYPNPANGMISLMAGNSQSQIAYKITDVTGKLILNGEFLGETTLNLSEIENGVYFVTFEAGAAASVSKLVISR